MPATDHAQLKEWSSDFAEMLGNFQHNPDRAGRVLRSLENMIDYFRAAIREQRDKPREGLLSSLMTAEVEGSRLTEEEVIANTIVTMVGGQETTTNLIGNGFLACSASPSNWRSCVTTPRSSHPQRKSCYVTIVRASIPARLVPEDCELGGKTLRKRDAVMAVMAAGNRDPERFPDPDQLDLRRADNRHLAFGWAAHFCFGAPLARIEGQIAFNTLLRRLRNVALAPQNLTWRENLGLRGLKSLMVSFERTHAAAPD